MTMVKAVRDLWADALTSGRFKRGKSALHLKSAKGNETFCCLGVLCVLYNEAHPDAPLPMGEESYYGSDLAVFPQVITYAGRKHYLPYAVREWAGLKDHEMRDLAGMNDGRFGKRGLSFRELAKKIRKGIFE